LRIAFNIIIALMTSSSVAHEQEQQTMEGLADYVSIKLFDENALVENFSGKQALIKILSDYETHGDIAQRAIKWRHYGIGASVAYALDALQVKDWKESVQNQGIAPITLLERSLGNFDGSQRLENIKLAYGYDAIKQETQAKVDSYKNYLDSLLDGYGASNGVSVTVAKLKRAGQNGGGKTKQLINLSDGTVLALDDNSFATSTDKAWNLRLKKVPYAFKGRQGEILFKVENDLSIVLDKQAYRLSDLLKNHNRISFQNISWTGGTSEFSCINRPGVMVVDKDQIYVEFL